MLPYAMLTRLNQRTESAAEGSIEQECREAEYWYEESPTNYNSPEAS